MKILSYPLLILSLNTTLVFASSTSNISGLSPKQACQFLKTLQTAIKNNQRKSIAEMVRYPLRQPGCIATSKKRCPMIADSQQFLVKYDQLIPLKTKQAVIKQTCNDLFYNYQGVMIGNGDVWYGPVDKAAKIIAINHS